MLPKQKYHYRYYYSHSIVEFSELNVVGMSRKAVVYFPINIRYISALNNALCVCVLRVCVC